MESLGFLGCGVLQHHLNETQLNRVRGGFSPPLPTPPGMRVRTGRFDEVTGP